MRVEVARDRCQGNGACVYTAPDVFALDDSGVVTVIGEFADDDQRIHNAVGECPVAALRLVKE
jgi:ferredoxin